ncbi:glycosyltransferase involved in cell wall biosynthesis [Lewinella aquimaris]|uniref:Glycosyltransferase involved in cell wall biosynthesis n=1 Tax=Neolewinella aquimaris TaxID=1835722 RepID=A0A840EB53_9BACT|nr:glycosyltransferase [Neolewinella aquimaris]MBB4078226.1 glycosyltransferase involved in cell wall biosynthesis [Neolewinella aquimaris]
MTIICFGPGPKFKGGISNYNTSLAKALDRRGDCDVHIVSWTQQYPAIVPREFVDKTSKVDLLEGTDIKVHYLTNYNNPLSWQETYRRIVDLKPDKVVFQWAIAIQGLPMGYIARKLKRHPEIEVVFDLHFVIQKENSTLDRRFTRYGISPADTFIAHAYKTVDELRELFPKRALSVNEAGTREQGTTTVIKLYHPIYELFAPRADFDVAAFKEKHGLREHVFLFFGFIRKYKGLHNAIKAFAKLAKQRDDVSLIICGESFWDTLKADKFTTKLKNATFGLAKKLFLSKADDERAYRPLDLLETLGIRDRVMVKNEFVANEEVHKYFQASDAVVLFYSYATPSGVESISYNFQLPAVATRVGHFPETIKDGYNGYLAKPDDTDDMARQMARMIDSPIPRENIRETTKEMSWDNYAAALVQGCLPAARYNAASGSGRTKLPPAAE